MIKDFIKDAKLSRLSYLLEVIEVRDFNSRIKAYNKIRKTKLTNEMGLLILKSINKKRINEITEVNIDLSLLLLVLSNYDTCYEEEVEKIYKDLTNDNKYEVLNILSLSSNNDAVLLYKKLLLKSYNKIDEIPTGSLALNKDNYFLLFPDLYKVLKKDDTNLLLLLTDFINLGVVPVSDLTKNKKVLQDKILKVFKDAISFKFNKDEHIMQNKNYIKLRILLESVITLEYYVSNTKTKEALEKIYKKKDNQIKLFILENYIKKGMDISKINLNQIARDNLSRYPLYSFLMFYNLERLMPKKYANNIALSESDLFINYSINFNYNVIPYDMEFIEERVVNNHKYYIYKFKTIFNYLEEVKDPATDYILKSTSIDKELKNAVTEYIGISGGFNKELDPSIIEKNLSSLLYSKIGDDINLSINNLVSKIEDEKIVIKKKQKKEKVKKEKKNSFIQYIISIFKNKKKKEKIKTKKKKEKKVKVVKEIKEVKEEEEKVVKRGILRRIFSYNTLLIIVSILLFASIIILTSYVKGYDILGLQKNDLTKVGVNSLKATTIKNDKYKEISYKDIFNQGEKEYYVLLYNKREVSIYNSLVDELIKNNYVFYYVDLTKEENKEIYKGNSTGFVISSETLLKVNEKEYEFYVVNKQNIIKEMKSYLDEIKAKKEAAKKEKQKKKVD